jgi:hypothetical protein
VFAGPASGFVQLAIVCLTACSATGSWLRCSTRITGADHPADAVAGRVSEQVPSAVDLAGAAGPQGGVEPRPDVRVKRPLDDIARQDVRLPTAGAVAGDVAPRAAVAAEIRFDPLGGMTFVTGSISHGQGHATIHTQIPHE